MSGRVIQGFFLGGQPRVAPGGVAPPQPGFAAQAKAGPRHPAPPRTAFAPTAGAAQRRGAPAGPPKPAFAPKQLAVAQRFGGNDAFAVDPARLGLNGSGGRALPEGVRGKMEAAFGADFSSVRVHVGPQAERVGAIAFTLGQDIYFAPGRFQPDTVQGQQLLGHELAHVVQQTQGRVRNPLGSGVAVVQDRALEAEADRWGHRAASTSVFTPANRLSDATAQRKRLGAPIYVPRTLRFGVVQRHLERFRQKSMLGDGEEVWINEQDGRISIEPYENVYLEVEIKGKSLNISHLQNGKAIGGLGAILVYLAAKRAEVLGIEAMSVEQPSAEGYGFYRAMTFGPDPGAFGGDPKSIKLMHESKLCPMIGFTADIAKAARASYEKKWKMTFDGSRGHH